MISCQEDQLRQNFFTDFDFTSMVFRSLQEGNQTDVSNANFSKAFDRVLRNTLLLKLKPL